MDVARALETFFLQKRQLIHAHKPEMILKVGLNLRLFKNLSLILIHILGRHTRTETGIAAERRID